MSARSRLTRRDIHGVLRALRRLGRRNKSDEVVATMGEILVEDEDKDFRRDSATDDTRGRTALAWLEESELLTREENRVRVFPSSLQVSTVEEARKKLEGKPISDGYRAQLLAIVKALIDADPDEGISTDVLMSTIGFESKRLRGALHDLENFGIASNETGLTAFVHVGGPRSSEKRFAEAAAVEEKLISIMQEMAPDMGVDDSAPLNLRVATQRIKDDGHENVRPEYVTRILRGIAGDGRGERGAGGSITVNKLDAESVWVTLKREWSSIAAIAQLRRSGAKRLLNHLLSRLPPGKRRGTDLLAETTLGKLAKSVDSDLTLRGQVSDVRKLVDRSLMWLHELEVVRLNRGLTVFRPAMTIHLEARHKQRGFANADFQSLQIHYDQTVRQIHVMAEFAQRGLQDMADALRLALDYFALGDEEFIHRWLPGRERELSRQTSPESWRDIVESLKNPSQRRLVADDRETTNVLVLAGPGSGKTRVLVHRIAYLIRVRREDPRGILALAYNRHAAVEIRRRLAELVGDDSRRVLVLTCHALAMRLVGTSFAERADRPASEQFQDILRQATALLHGEGLATEEEAEESRARLLAGFRWILVDEYQDVGRDEYNLISALAGRTQTDADAKLTLFAVGDDDQNIYAFKGSSVQFIRRFEEDYQARPAFLTDNYRSTRHIIDAANAVIEPAQNRMKADHEIQIDKGRSRDPAGGRWAALDPVTHGKVQVFPAGRNAISQAQAAMVELQRLASLDAGWDWSRCAVIAREWNYLHPLRSLCELEGIPVDMANEEIPSVWHLRETQALLDWLRQRDPALVGIADLSAWLSGQMPTPWTELLQEAFEDHEVEAGPAEIPVASFIEWLAEWGREARKRQRGLLLATAHRAKGLEFDHVIVLDGGWGRGGQDQDPDAERRLYYVAMTRARQTLALGCLGQPNAMQEALRDSAAVVWREPVGLPPPAPELSRRYLQLNLKNVYLSFAGRKPPNHPVRRALAALSPNDPLRVQERSGKWELLDDAGVVVGTLAKSFKPPEGMTCSRATVFAIVSWSRDRSEPQYQEQLNSDTWEVVVPELIFEPS